jgi:hypothetical protein
MRIGALVIRIRALIIRIRAQIIRMRALITRTRPRIQGMNDTSTPKRTGFPCHLVSLQRRFLCSTADAHSEHTGRLGSAWASERILAWRTLWTFKLRESSLGADVGRGARSPGTDVAAASPVPALT